MMRKFQLCVLIISMYTFCCPPGMAQTTRIFVVRHADRQSSDDLDAAGLVRAEELKRVLFSTGIDSIFSTDFLRTKKTVQPLADTLHLPVKIYDNNSNLFNRILTDNSGKTLLVVGHSNTVPQLIQLCGCRPPFENIPATQFDDLFLIILEQENTKQLPKISCKLLHIKYGATTH